MHGLHPLSALGNNADARTVSVLVLGEREMTAQQAAEVENAFERHKTMLRLSLVGFLTGDEVLSDGTRVSFVSNGGLHQVIVLPPQPGPGEETPYIAYPAFVDLSFCTPVFDRFVFDGTTEVNPIPPPPEFTPYPPRVPVPMPSLPDGGYRIEFDADTQTWTAWWMLFTATNPDGVRDSIIATHTRAEGDFDDFGLREPSYMTGPYMQGLVDSPPQEQMEGDPGPVHIVRTGMTTDGRARISMVQTWGATTQSLIDNLAAENGARMQAWTAEEEASQAAWFAANQAHIDAYNEAVAAWASTYGTTPLNWNSEPIRAARVANRPAQLAALRAFLDTGIGHQHLTARLLSFPFNVRSRPVLTMADAGSGSVTVGTDVSEGPGLVHKKLPVAYAAAIHTTLDLGTEVGSYLAQPTSLYGWKATGELQWYASYHGLHAGRLGEPREVRGLEALTFEQRSGYEAFANGGFVGDSAPNLRINSDTFVPPGATATVVHLEWEAWDAYTGQWTWTPTPDIGQATGGVDAIWIKTLGSEFALPTLTGAPSHSPRAVRIRSSRRQSRKTDWSWSAPEDAQLPVGEPVELPAAWVDSVTPFPCAVVLVQKLAAKPNPEGTTVFPFGATWLWSERPRQIKTILSVPWEDSTGLARLLAQVLAITKKVPA